ncbi:MAG TPA: gluconokinase [Chloroflexota bacterium]|nr:gluconokinase [Chloroflexota bacterium]
MAPDEAADPLILAIDVGTSSARALVYDGEGRQVRGWENHRPYAVRTSPDGGVTIDPDGLVELVAGCLDAVLHVMSRPPAAVACDTFWHSLLVADGSGTPLTPVLTWADTRSGPAAAKLRSHLDGRAVHARTGCVLHSSYWPAKLAWLRTKEPEVMDRAGMLMGFGEYLYLHLFGDRRVSISMASGTGLLDQNACAWDPKLCEVLQISEAQLSPVVDYTDSAGGLRSPFRSRWPQLDGIPWFLPLGDGACNNIGSGGTTPEWLVAMIGTSGALRVVRTAERVDIPWGVWTYHVDRRRFIQGGALSDGGNVFAWLMQTVQHAPVTDVERQLAAMQPDAHGLTVLPFLAGERSPDWNVNARAALVGMTLATTPIDVIRASLEAVAYRFGVVYDVLRAVLPPTRGIIGSGAGLIHSPAWLQIMTDVLGEPVVVSAVPEASGRGAALLALEALGHLPDVTAAPVPLADTYRPHPDHTRAYRAAAQRQQRLYDLLIGDSSRGDV